METTHVRGSNDTDRRQRTQFFIIGAAVAIVLLGFALRLAVLDRDLTFDDAYSVYYAQKPFSEIIHFTGQEVAGVPLYYVLLHCWMKVFGTGEVVVRLLSVFMSLGAIFIVYRLGSLMFEKIVGIVAGLLMAVSSIHVLLSEEVRPYTLVVLLSLYSLYYLWRYRLSQRTVFLWLNAGINLLLVYAHLQGWFVVAAEVLFVILYFRRVGLRLAPWIVSELGVVAGFTPWFFYSILPNMGQGALVSSWLAAIRADTPWFMVVDLPINFILAPKYITAHLEPAAAVWYGLCVAGVMLSLFSFSTRTNRFVKIRREDVPQRMLLMFTFCIPLIAFLFFRIPLPKYYIVASAPLFLLMVYGARAGSVSRSVKVIVLCAIVLSPALFLPRMVPAEHAHQQRESVRFFEQRERPGDIIIVYHFKSRLFFDYYYRGASSVYGLYPKEDYRNLDDEIARYNTVLQAAIDEESVGVLSRMTAGAQRVWYYSSVGTERNVYRADLPLAWFKQNDWRIADQIPLPRGFVILYER